jgi:hypothetical protein
VHEQQCGGGAREHSAIDVGQLDAQLYDDRPDLLSVLFAFCRRFPSLRHSIVSPRKAANLTPTNSNAPIKSSQGGNDSFEQKRCEMLIFFAYLLFQA